MRKKKGVSPLIATVMLVGFAVALAAVVSTFVIKETKKFNPESFLEESPYCENIVIEAVQLHDAQGKPRDILIEKLEGGFYTLKGMGVKNKGSFVVKRYIFKSGGKELPVIPDVGEGKPGQITQVNGKGLVFFPKDGEERIIKIQPAVNDPEKEKIIPCPKQEITVNYKTICCSSGVTTCKGALPDGLESLCA